MMLAWDHGDGAAPVDGGVELQGVECGRLCREHRARRSEDRSEEGRNLESGATLTGGGLQFKVQDERRQGGTTGTKIQRSK